MNNLDKMARRYDDSEKRIEALKDERISVFAEFLQAQDENKDAKAVKLKAKLATIDGDIELEKERVKALYAGMLAQAEKDIRDEMADYDVEMKKFESDFEAEVEKMGQALGMVKTYADFLGFGSLAAGLQNLFRGPLGGIDHQGSNTLLQHVSAGAARAIEELGDVNFQQRRSDLRSIEVLISHPTSIENHAKKPVATAILKVRRSGSE